MCKIFFVIRLADKHSGEMYYLTRSCKQNLTASRDVVLDYVVLVKS